MGDYRSSFGQDRPVAYKLVGKDVVPLYSLIEYIKCFEDTNNRIVKQTEVSNFMVSTVFLCLDHNYLHVGKPILFETMIFTNWNSTGRARTSFDYQKRCCTYDEAVLQHEEAIAYLNHQYKQSTRLERSHVFVNEAGKIKLSKSSAMVARLLFR